MLTVHEHKGFINPLRVRIAIAEKGLQERVRYVQVDVLKAEHRTEAFRQKNPSATVPVLELEDGTFLAESAAITEYLDHLDGEPTLTGNDARRRGLVHMMQRVAEAEVLDAVAAWFHHATPGLGPALETDPLPAWGERNRARALAGMRRLDTWLASHPFVGGDSFSVADITAYAGLEFARFAGLPIPDDCCNLVAWQARTAARPSVVAAQS